MNPSSRGPVYTMDSGYSGNRQFFTRIGPPSTRKVESAHLRLSYILPEFYSSKRILENCGNLREKIDKFENFEHSPDILSIFHGKLLTKRFLLYSYRPREGSVRLNATAMSKAPSTEHNKSAAFHRSPLHYNLSAIIHQKGPSL